MYEKSQVRTRFSLEEPPLVSVIVQLFFSLFLLLFLFFCFFKRVDATESFTLPPDPPSSLSPPSFLPFLKHIFPHQTRIVCGSRPRNSSTCSYAVERADVLVVQACGETPARRRAVGLFVSLLPLNHCARGSIMVIYIYIYVEIYIRNIYIYEESII